MGRKAHDEKAELKTVLMRPKKAQKSFLKAHRINFGSKFDIFE
jgi:hypothetical protein